MGKKHLEALGSLIQIDVNDIHETDMISSEQVLY